MSSAKRWYTIKMTTASKTLLGIDYGTGGCKVTMLGTDGSFVGEASVEYTTYHDHPGWSEQEPQDWWDALCAALRKLRDKGVDLSKEPFFRVAVTGVF